MTALNDDLLRLIGSSFRSVWALELLLLLKRDPKSQSDRELVLTLRASDLVVNRALDELVAAGLVTLDEEGARYLPINEEVARQIDGLEKLYATRPDAVRRAIVLGTSSSAAAFADAFRLRKD